VEDKLIQQLLERLKKSVDKHSTTVLSDNEQYTQLPLSTENFSSLLEVPEQSIAYVDGGNAPLLESSNFSLQFMRVYASWYVANKKVGSMRKEGYVFITAQPEAGKTIFIVEGFGIDVPIARFEAEELSGAVGTVRRMIEIELAASLAEDHLVILDGDLQTHGEESLEPLRNVRVAGLAKTTTLQTDAGQSAVAAVHKLSPEGTWQYNPVFKHNSQLPSVSFVKLHPQSRYVFKLESFQNNTHEIASAIARHARDPSFVGYPYGLIDADRHARISTGEREYMRMKILNSLGKDWEGIRGQVHSVDAHDVLDSLSNKPF